VTRAAKGCDYSVPVRQILHHGQNPSMGSILIRDVNGDVVG
jgi:hypothetical protein